MLPRLLFGAPLALSLGCSLLIELDEPTAVSNDESLGAMGGSLLPGEDVDANNEQPDDEDPSTGSGGNSSVPVLGTGGLSGEGGGTSGPPLPPPLHYYRLDEGMGSIVTDSGNAEVPVVGQVTEEMEWSTGIRGGAYSVTEGHAIVLDASVLPAGEFTLSFWLANAKNDYRLLAEKTGARGEGGFRILQDNRRIQVILGDTATESYLAPPGDALPLASEARWTHVIFSYKKNAEVTLDRISIWINGRLHFQEAGSFNGAVTSNVTVPLRFGDVPNNGNQQFVGLVDEIRIYDEEFTNDYALQLFLEDGSENREDEGAQD